MAKKRENKLYVIRKYVLATSLKDAHKKERRVPIDEIWLDEDWKKSQGGGTNTIGFH